MEELLAAASDALKVPEDLVRRSAAARAKAQGVSAEDVLRAWTGGGAPAVPAPAPAGAAAPAPAPPAAPAPVPPAAPAAEPSGPAVDVLGPDVAAAETAPAGDEGPEPEEPAAGAALPRWLAAVLLVVPALAVLYALFLPNGPNCGDAGALAVDPATGAAVNCDGSQYGVDQVDFFTMGSGIYAQCASCHGENGGGGGNFPAFADGALLSTFPAGSCADHVEWVRVGTSGWPEPTYGATGKPVGGSGAVMPAFGPALSEEELRSVVLYERVQFGGLDVEATVSDCGLDEIGIDAATDE